MARTRHDRFPAIELPESLDAGRAKGEQLREILEAMVAHQPPGTLLPSERSLAERFRLARMTVRQAIDDLAVRGLVRRARGTGTFVAEPRLSHGTTAGSFSDDMRRRGMVPGARVVSVREHSASMLVAERLRIGAGDPVVTLDRLRSADGVPMAVEQTRLPATRFPGLADLISDDVSLYGVLAERWGVRVHRAAHRVSVVGLAETDAALLDAPTGLPSFLIERTAYDEAGRVIEWGRSRYRGDRYDVIFDVAAD
ncbi:GntR family transcriptional regulator [Actinocatenispora thailandica]|uniref:GntR family transcriptional regulator n=1 Tax=Actinocatenispora thailandica TaxID=227318 RepID=A0A7R7DP62_9ACTN|nr:GntR family transcriptional regulator [Actinocatenispora thailandica]BCJ35325.1 GntR family transcriptional regulator [Actinocatenispora thailandica]